MHKTTEIYTAQEDPRFVDRVDSRFTQQEMLSAEFCNVVELGRSTGENDVF